MFVNPGPFSYSPRGFSADDFQQRRGIQQDDLRSSLQRSISRPSGKSIYMQRKEYSEVLNRQSDSFQFRVEHLFTCELDGQEVKSLNDCVAKLKKLDAKGRLWPQDVIMEVQAGCLLLSDIETKSELESLPLSSILQSTAVLDSCDYNSLLMISVQDHSKRFPQVFMFQCEETGAEDIRGDLDKLVQNRGGFAEVHRDLPDIRSNMENIISHQPSGSFRQAGPHFVEGERMPPPPDHPAPQWNYRDPENAPRMLPPHEETIPHPNFMKPQNSLDVPPAPDKANTDRNMDILNHVITDMEIFVAEVVAAANASPPQQETKKKSKKKSKMKTGPPVNLPPWEEYVSCLQKIKYGFNLLAHLDKNLTNPTAPDYVHIFFSCLGEIVRQYPADLPPTVISPLLTDAALRLLTQVVMPDEDQLWRLLGDSWNIPRSQWPQGDVPPFIPQFYDGWQPPPPLSPSPPSHQNGPLSRSNSQRFPPDQPDGQPPNSPWAPPPPPTGRSEPPMRVIYDFMARNNQELSVMKGDMVQVIQKSKQWWLVRNSRNEEGHVPQNVLEPMSSGPTEETQWGTGRPVTLDLNSSPPEVKAWLEYKGFSRITVSSLGVLSGKLLLGMSKDEIRTVCPEEGGKVFFQLQGVKSSIALASEQSGMYNSRY